MLSAQGSSLSHSDSGNTEGNWADSDLRSYIQTSYYQRWTCRKGRKQGGQQEPNDSGGVEKGPGRIGDQGDKGWRSSPEEFPNNSIGLSVGTEQVHSFSDVVGPFLSLRLLP